MTCRVGVAGSTATSHDHTVSCKSLMSERMKHTQKPNEKNFMN